MAATAEPRAAARPVPEDLPPALSSMWRLCKLGYRHEPGLLLAAFLLSLAAALPDALLALWLALLGPGGAGGRRAAAGRGRGRPGTVGGRHLGPAGGRLAGPAPLPRPGHHRP